MNNKRRGDDSGQYNRRSRPATIEEKYYNLREDSNAQRDKIDELTREVESLMEHVNTIQGTEQEKGILAAKVESLRDFIDSYGLGLIAEEEGLKDEGSTEEGATEEGATEEGATEEGATEEVLTEEDDFVIMKKMEQEAKNDLSVPIDEQQQVEENSNSMQLVEGETAGSVQSQVAPTIEVGPSREEKREIDDALLKSYIIDINRKVNALLDAPRKQSITLPITKNVIIQKLLDPNNLFSKKINYTDGFKIEENASELTILNGINHFFQVEYINLSSPDTEIHITPTILGMHTVIPAEVSHDFGKVTVDAFKKNFKKLLTELHNKIRSVITQQRLDNYNDLCKLFFKKYVPGEIGSLIEDIGFLIDYDEADIGLLILGLLTKTPGQTSRVLSTSAGVHYQLGSASNLGGTCPDFSRISNGKEQHRPIQITSDADASWSIKFNQDTPLTNYLFPTINDFDAGAAASFISDVTPEERLRFTSPFLQSNLPRNDEEMMEEDNTQENGGIDWTRYEKGNIKIVLNSILTGNPVLKIESADTGFHITLLTIGVLQEIGPINIKSVNKTDVERTVNNLVTAHTNKITPERYCYLMMLKQLGDSIVYPTIHFKKLYVMYRQLRDTTNEDLKKRLIEILYNTVHMINSGDYSNMFAMTNQFIFKKENGQVDGDFMQDLQKMPAYISGKITGQQNGFFPYSLNSIIETRLMHQLVDEIQDLTFYKVGNLSEFMTSITQFFESKKRGAEYYSVDRVVSIPNYTPRVIFDINNTKSLLGKTFVMVNKLLQLAGVQDDVLIEVFKNFSDNVPIDNFLEHYYTNGKELYTKIIGHQIYSEYKEFIQDFVDVLEYYLLFYNFFCNKKPEYFYNDFDIICHIMDVMDDFNDLDEEQKEKYSFLNDYIQEYNNIQEANDMEEDNDIEKDKKYAYIYNFYNDFDFPRDLAEESLKESIKESLNIDDSRIFKFKSNKLTDLKYICSYCSIYLDRNNMLKNLDIFTHSLFVESLPNQYNEKWEIDKKMNAIYKSAIEERENNLKAKSDIARLDVAKLNNSDDNLENIVIDHRLYGCYNNFVNRIVHMSGFSNHIDEDLPSSTQNNQQDSFYFPPDPVDNTSMQEGETPGGMNGGAVLAIDLDDKQTQEFLAALNTYFQNKGQKKESPNEPVREVVKNDMQIDNTPPPPPPSSNKREKPVKAVKKYSKNPFQRVMNANKVLSRPRSTPKDSSGLDEESSDEEPSRLLDSIRRRKEAFKRKKEFESRSKKRKKPNGGNKKTRKKR